MCHVLMKDTVTGIGPGMQLIQGKLADMYTVTAATRAFVYKTAAEADAERADRKDCAAVILYAAEHATRMALDAIQVSSFSRLLPASCCAHDTHALMDTQR